MENEQSSFNLIHYECNLNQLKKSTALDVQVGVTGGWINDIAILQFKWRIMCNAENITALHFLAENNYVIPDVKLFTQTKMKMFLLKSCDKVNKELGIRTKEEGNILASGYFSDTMVTNYYKDFLQAIDAR